MHHRVFTTLVATLLAILLLSSPVAADTGAADAEAAAAAATASMANSSSTPADTCGGPLIIRGIMNEGHLATHKNCTWTDHMFLQNAIWAAFSDAGLDLPSFDDAVTSKENPERRRLGGGGRAGTVSASTPSRLLRNNGKRTLSCASLCEEVHNKVTCQHNFGNCASWARNNCSGGDRCGEDRDLRQADDNHDGVSLVVVDDYLFRNSNDVIQSDPDDHTNRRQLKEAEAATNACRVSMEDCLVAKMLFYETVLFNLVHVDPTCANLALSPNLLQCIVPILSEH